MWPERRWFQSPFSILFTLNYPPLWKLQKMHWGQRIAIHWFPLLLVEVGHKLKAISCTTETKRGQTNLPFYSMFPLYIHLLLWVFLFSLPPFVADWDFESVASFWLLISDYLLWTFLMLCNCGMPWRHDILMSVSHISSRCELTGLMFGLSSPVGKLCSCTPTV